jgi:hypothetical protein
MEEDQEEAVETLFGDLRSSQILDTFLHLAAKDAPCPYSETH